MCAKRFAKGIGSPRFAKAMKLMEERARVPLFLTYRAVGSSTGQKEFVGDSASSSLDLQDLGRDAETMKPQRMLQKEVD